MAAYIAIDWGTSNRRAFRIGDDGRVQDGVRDDRGVLTVSRADFPAEIEALRERLDAREVIAAGMIGSTRGWIDAAYVPAPATAADLALAAVSPAPDVIVVPGVSRRDSRRTDVMRGEETMVLGAVALGNAASSDGLYCQPGTHNKWIAIDGGRIADFSTAMTGELFGLLRANGTLAGMLDGPVEADAHFDAGLARGAGACDLAAALFEVRAQVLLGVRPVAAAASYASGILIGADVGARDDIAGRTVRLLAAGPLADLYAVAIERAGGRAVRHDAEAAFVAGIHTIRSLLP